MRWWTGGWITVLGATFLAAAAGADPCGDAMILDGIQRRLAVPDEPVRYYVEALENLAAALDGAPEATRRLVQNGLAGAWSDEARLTLRQNPRLHRALFPRP